MSVAIAWIPFKSTWALATNTFAIRALGVWVNAMNADDNTFACYGGDNDEHDIREIWSSSLKSGPSDIGYFTTFARTKKKNCQYAFVKTKTTNSIRGDSRFV